MKYQTQNLFIFKYFTNDHNRNSQLHTNLSYPSVIMVVTRSIGKVANT